MAKVKFNIRVYINGLSYEAGKVVEVNEAVLKTYPKKDYVIVRGIDRKGKKTKDIPAKDKDTSVVTLEIDDKLE